MKKVRWTGYDKYLVFADKTNVLKGNYNGYINFKDVMDVVDKLHAKRNNSYLYNGELLTFDIKQGDIESLYNSWHEGEYRRGFDVVRKVANKLNFKII
jgi:hypothetical protein|tara:strand:- start:317 stop:610 length:294 start_codon:yes stop_codon:yes gene_type:complete